MVSHSELREIFRSADAVCFDVDSTVIREEGIDELAKFCGVGDAVSEMYESLNTGSLFGQLNTGDSLGEARAGVKVHQLPSWAYPHGQGSLAYLHFPISEVVTFLGAESMCIYTNPTTAGSLRS